MPTNQCVGFDHRQGVPPVEETGEMRERKANGVGSPSRLDFSINIQAKLLPEEEIFSSDCGW